VLIRSAVASFYAQGDTATPLWASLTAVAVNVAFKIVLMGPLEQAGLALATSVGAWTNLGLLVLLATRRGAMRLDRRFLNTACAIGAATLAMGLAMAGVDRLAGARLALHPGIEDLVRLALVGAAGGLTYVAVSGFLLRRIIGSLLARRRATSTRAIGSPDPAGSRDIPPAVPPD
jgi:putative peptidoglycan lipid II flippase